jgi:hypothetical protein
MLASRPASILNQKHARAGISNRVNLRLSCSSCAHAFLVGGVKPEGDKS